MGAAKRILEIAKKQNTKKPTIGVVLGDDLLDYMSNDEILDSPTMEGLDFSNNKITAANVYLGAQPIAEALKIPAFGTMDQYSDGSWHGNAKSKAGFAGSQMQRYLDWDYLKEVRDIWSGPIILKGLMDINDAVQASKIIDAIYLSNHGGRQIDLVPNPLQVLPSIRKKIPPNKTGVKVFFLIISVYQILQHCRA